MALSNDFSSIRASVLGFFGFFFRGRRFGVVSGLFGGNIGAFDLDPFAETVASGVGLKILVFCGVFLGKNVYHACKRLDFLFDFLRALEIDAMTQLVSFQGLEL